METQGKSPLTQQKRIILLFAFLAGGQEGSLNLRKLLQTQGPGQDPVSALGTCPVLQIHTSWAGEMCFSQSVG